LEVLFVKDGRIVDTRRERGEHLLVLGEVIEWLTIVVEEVAPSRSK